jgi:hypothetical protein
MLSIPSVLRLIPRREGGREERKENPVGKKEHHVWQKPERLWVLEIWVPLLAPQSGLCTQLPSILPKFKLWS